MVKPSVVYIISDVDKSLEFEWTAKYFSSRLELQFIIIGNSKTNLADYLQSMNIKCEFVTDEKYPHYLQKIWRTYWILKTIRPVIVHCHLWRAMLAGLPAAYLAGVNRRIFTRHYSMIHYYEFLGGRKWDRLCNWLATDIIAISENVKQVLLTKDKAADDKIQLIHHGFDLSYFSNVEQARINKVKTKYNIPEGGPVIGVISRYLKLKGIQYIIPAFQKLKEKYPTTHLVLANAHGPYHEQIHHLLNNLPQASFTEIIFENDLAGLYQVFDIFVHVPVDGEQEAFGQTYVESLASGIPSIFTISGVAPEFIVHEQNALVVPYKDAHSIFVAMDRIIGNTELALALVKHGKESAALFPIQKMLKSLENLYGYTGSSSEQ